MSYCNHEIENDIVETQDENGKTIQFEVLDIIDFEDKEYALLYPLQKTSNSYNNENECDEAVIMRLLQENEEYIFELIDDDDEFQRVEEYIRELQEIL